jgi:uncharacterized membrane protein
MGRAVAFKFRSGFRSNSGLEQQQEGVHHYQQLLQHNEVIKMQFLIILLVALVASASAFAPRSFARASSVKAMVRNSITQLQVVYET